METVKYRGYEIKIDSDDDTESPRTAWDNFGTMVCFHHNYRLGDQKHGFSNPDELMKYLKVEEKNLVVLPLRLYDHSGITMSVSNSYPFNDQWDSMLVGFIFVTKDKIRKKFGVKAVTKAVRQRVIDSLKAEVDLYDTFIRGEVYYFSVDDKDGEALESCGGFFGYDHEKSGLMEIAKNAIDCHIASQRKKHFDKLKEWIRNKVNLQYRKPMFA